MSMHEEDSIIEKYHPHFLAFFGFYFIGILVFILGIFFMWQVSVFGILIFILGEILRRAETFYILDHGVSRGYRLFSTSRKSVLYDNIQNIEVHQNFLENILGVGHIKFDTSGSDNVEVHFYSVEKPYNIEKKVRERMTLLKNS